MSNEMSMNGHGGPSLHAKQRGKELHHPTTIGLQTARLPKWERVATGGAGERSFTDKQKAVFRKRRRDRFKIPDGSRWGDVKAASTNIGRAYEYLIKQFADDAGGKAGEFFTPPEVVDTLVYILEPRPGDTVYDPIRRRLST